MSVFGGSVLCPTLLPDTLPEADFEDTIIHWAKINGWRRHAERASRTQSGRHATAIKGDQGWPDLVLGHPHHGIVIAELKAKKGSKGPGQQEWLDVLAAHDVPGSPVLVEYWKPADWPAIVSCLHFGVDDYRALYRH